MVGDAPGHPEGRRRQRGLVVLCARLSRLAQIEKEDLQRCSGSLEISRMGGFDRPVPIRGLCQSHGVQHLGQKGDGSAERGELADSFEAIRGMAPQRREPCSLQPHSLSAQSLEAKPSEQDVQIDLDVPRTISGHLTFHTRYGHGCGSFWLCGNIAD